MGTLIAEECVQERIPEKPVAANDSEAKSILFLNLDGRCRRKGREWVLAVQADARYNSNSATM
jgi:hypothetical protein